MTIFAQNLDVETSAAFAAERNEQNRLAEITKAVQQQQAAMITQLGLWQRNWQYCWKPGISQANRKQAQQMALQAKDAMVKHFREQARLVNLALDIDDRLAITDQSHDH